MTDFSQMDGAAAAEVLDRWLTELAFARKEKDAAVRRAAGLRKMVDAIVEMFPELEDNLPVDLDEGAPERPRGAAAVLLILRNHGQWLSVNAVVRFLDQQKWLPAESTNPANAVRSALERLVEQGVVLKQRDPDGTVLYRAKSPKELEEPF